MCSPFLICDSLVDLNPVLDPHRLEVDLEDVGLAPGEAGVPEGAPRVGDHGEEGVHTVGGEAVAHAHRAVAQVVEEVAHTVEDLDAEVVSD